MNIPKKTNKKIIFLFLNKNKKKAFRSISSDLLNNELSDKRQLKSNISYNNF